jgi:tetratricopeptide (TPR) repeat protein
MPDSHVWITGAGRAACAAAAAAYDPGAWADCHRRLRGPYTGTGSVLRTLVPQVHERDKELPARHAIEILAAAPELEPLTGPAAETLTSMAPPEERTRWYSHYRTRRIAHGIIDFLASCAAAGPLTLCFASLDHADPTDLEFLSIALRRLDPAQVRLIVCSRHPVAALAGQLTTYCQRHVAAGSDDPAQAGRPAAGAAAAYVESDCTSDVPGERDAYLALTPAERAKLHDRRAQELEAAGEWSLQLGAIPYHREHGTQPGAVRPAYSNAINYCIGMAFYDWALELAGRFGSLCDPDSDPDLYYKVQTAKAQCLALLERPAETEPIYYDLLSRLAKPMVHMNVSYAIAMLYTRLLDEEHKDHLRARAHVNTAVAIASQLEDPHDRAFHTVFMNNGKALIEMHLGNLQASLALVTGGIERLDRELTPDKYRLHRSVLNHNRAQVYAALGRSQEALAEFDHVIELDRCYPEYHFDRANLLLKLGRLDEAVAGYQDAIRAGPPFPELYFNRGTALAASGDLGGAMRDFRYVLDLEPDFTEARVSLASLLVEQGEAQRAEAEARAGLAFVPGEARLHCTLGLALLELAQPEAARKAFDQALSLDPGLPEARVNRAVAAHELGQHDAAIADLTSALDADPANPDLLYNRGFVLEGAGRCEDALADYTQALRSADADRPELLYRRGRCLVALGRAEDAAGDFKAHLAAGESPYEHEIAKLLAILPDRNMGQAADSAPAGEPTSTRG